MAKSRLKYEKLVENILYKPPPYIVETLQWGKSNENIARRCYINEKKGTHSASCRVFTAGIYVCTQQPWLAASPDGLVEDPSEPSHLQYGLLEILCPYSAWMYTPEIACTELNSFAAIL